MKTTTKERARWVVRNAVILVLLVVLYAVAFDRGRDEGYDAGVRDATCHAITEDSPPHDCDYDGRAWVPTTLGGD